MTALPTWVLVGLGGCVGALLRYATVTRLDASAFPLGTLAVNLVGSFALGFLAFSGVGGEAMLVVGVGACGAFTTFSSFAHDTVRLVESGRAWRGGTYALGTLLGALGGVGLAWLVVG